MDAVKWGFIGCGNVVYKKSGAAFRNTPDSTIHTIMRRDISKAEESARFFGAPAWCDSVDALLASGVNAAYISTVPGLHYEHAMKCCERGIPVYIEKPIARNYTESKAIVSAFEEAGVPIFVGHYRRALPRFHRIKELIDSGTIGKVTMVQSNLNRIFSKDEAEKSWLYKPELSGGGKFYDIAAHSFDAISYLLGNITSIGGYAVNSGTDCPLEDTVTCAFMTEKGVLGASTFNCIAYEKNDSVKIIGTMGSIEFSVHGNYEIRIRTHQPDGEAVEVIQDPEIIEGPMVKEVVAYLLGQDSQPCFGKDALPTYWAIDEVLALFYDDRQGRFWEEA